MGLVLVPQKGKQTLLALVFLRFVLKDSGNTAKCNHCRPKSIQFNQLVNRFLVAASHMCGFPFFPLSSIP